jgi:hypothetical protein
MYPRNNYLVRVLQFACLIVFIFSSLAFGQAPPWGKALSFGSSGSDLGSVVRVDRRSNKYVGGYFSGKVNFESKTLTSAGDRDGFLMKFRSDGTFGWIVQIGGADYDQVFDIGFDGNENLYVSGAFTDAATFGNNHGSSSAITGAGKSIFLAKYDPSGTLLWVQTGVSGFGDNEGFGVAVNPASGIVYMTGRAQGAVAFSSANGSSHAVPGTDRWHMYLVKYDSAGNFQWGETNFASVNSVAHRVAIDAENNAYAVGWFEGDATFTSRHGKDQTLHGRSHPIQSFPDFPDDAFVVKYNSHGDLQWANDIGGYKAIANDVAASHDGKVSVTGFIGNINVGDSVQADTIVSSQPPGSTIDLAGGDFTFPYNPDVFLATYDSNGVALSARRIGASKLDAAGGVAYDADGNLYLSGTFGGTIEIDGTILAGADANNLFVLKFAGKSLAWAKMGRGAGTGATESEPPLCVNSATGKVFVTGRFTGKATIGNTTLNSVGAEDIFFVSIPE